MRSKIIIAVLLTLTVASARAQEVTKLKSVTLSHKVVQASLDRQGNIYLASDNGDIDRYDKEGNLSYHFSPDTKGNVSLIEAWQGLRTFVFYRDFQQYLFLDRFLNASDRFTFGNNLSRYYQLATVAGDNNLWLVDQQELSLKKFDINLNEFLIETPLNLNLDPDNFELTHIREYQNLLFISDKFSGVLIFDNLGNYLDVLPVKEMSYFSFAGNDLLGMTPKGLKIIDIYSKKERLLPNPSKSQYIFTFRAGLHYYMISDNRLDIYKAN